MSGKKFEEELKRKQLKERRKQLEEQRKNIVEQAEAAKDAKDYQKAADLFMKAAQLSKDLAEKERMRTFRATAEEMLNLEKAKRQEEELSQIRSKLEVERRRLLADAETKMKEGLFKEAASVYEQAAKLSEQMKEEDRAKEFLAMAKEIRDKEFEYRKQWEANREKNLKEAQLVKILSAAEAALDQEGKEEEAAKNYIEASKIARALGNRGLAEKYAERAKEIREIKKKIEKQRAEQLQQQELEKKRRMYEDERSQAIVKAEKAMELGKFKEAARYYEIAGDASSGLGEKAIAQEFKATAKKILETIDQLRAEFNEKKRQLPLEKNRRILIAKARRDLENENFLEAARNFKKAAVISAQLGQDAKTKELINKVKSAMNSEKSRKEEIIGRVMKAFTAIITLRTMEPEIAVDLYEWTADQKKQIVITIWDVGSLTIRFKKGKPEIVSGEVLRDVDVRIEGTAASIMKVAQGNLSPTWAWLTGRITIHGSSSDVSHFLNIMIVPTLEREKDELDKRSTWLGLTLVGLTAWFVTYLPIWPDLSRPDIVKPLIDVINWGQTISNTFVYPIPFIGPFLTRIIHPWIWANMLLFPMIYIIISSALNYVTIRRYRISRAKEKLRIKRRRAMTRAESFTKKSQFRDAIRLYEEALKLALLSGESEIAQELGNKIVEIYKLIPKGGKKKKKGKGKKGKGGKKRGQTRAQFEKDIEESKKEILKFEKEIDEMVQKAEAALEQQDFLASAKFYAKAAEIAKNIGDKDKVVQFSAQSEELQNIYNEIQKSRKEK
ncbi:MAG: SCP2 sterol-binding domain-containing protein [Promethearchaeota archaeon]